MPRLRPTHTSTTASGMMANCGSSSTPVTTREKVGALVARFGEPAPSPETIGQVGAHETAPDAHLAVDQRVARVQSLAIHADGSMGGIGIAADRRVS